MSSWSQPGNEFTNRAAAKLQHKCATALHCVRTATLPAQGGREPPLTCLMQLLPCRCLQLWGSNQAGRSLKFRRNSSRHFPTHQFISCDPRDYWINQKYCCWWLWLRKDTQQLYQQSCLTLAWSFSRLWRNNQNFCWWRKVSPIKLEKERGKWKLISKQWLAHLREPSTADFGKGNQFLPRVNRGSVESHNLCSAMC